MKKIVTKGTNEPFFISAIAGNCSYFLYYYVIIIYCYISTTET